MLTKEQQLKEWDRVVAMCKGTKFEGKEYLCVKALYNPSIGYEVYDFSRDTVREFIANTLVDIDRIFAIAIVDDMPIWLEEPFMLYLKHRDYSDYVFTYSKDTKHLIGSSSKQRCKINIQLSKVEWLDFTLCKHVDSKSIFRKNFEDTTYLLRVDSKQIGGSHYKTKAIQPWVYMEANYTREEFIGFLKGNAHKYLDRYKEKNGIEDLKKAIHYIEKLLQVESK